MSSEGARAAAQAEVVAVQPARPVTQLADELELLEAVRALAMSLPRATVEVALHELATVAAELLACRLAAVYVADGARLAVCGQRPPEALAEALAEAIDSGSVPDTLALGPHRLLPLTGVARGVLLVAEPGVPTGHVGDRLAEVGSAGLGVALTREWVVCEARRLHAAFATCEG